MQSFIQTVRQNTQEFVHLGLGIYLLKRGTCPNDEDLAILSRDTVNPTYIVGLANENEVWIVSCEYTGFLPPIEIRESLFGISVVFHDLVQASQPGELQAANLLEFSRKVPVRNRSGLEALLTELGRRLLVKEGLIKGSLDDSVELTNLDADLNRALRYIEDLSLMRADMEYMDSQDDHDCLLETPTQLITGNR